MAGALDYIGIKRALHQKIDRGVRGKFRGLRLKNADKLLANNLTLLFRIADIRQTIEEALTGINGSQGNTEMIGKRLNHLLTLACAHTAVVHENTGQLIANSPVY